MEEQLLKDFMQYLCDNQYRTIEGDWEYVYNSHSEKIPIERIIDRFIALKK